MNKRIHSLCRAGTDRSLLTVSPMFKGLLQTPPFRSVNLGYSLWRNQYARVLMGQDTYLCLPARLQRTQF